MTASIIIDIIIVVGLLVGAVIGFFRGFIMTVAKPVKFFASLAIAGALAELVANAIIQPTIQMPITSQITNYLLEQCANLTSATAGEELPTLLKFAAAISGVDISAIVGETAESFIPALVDQLAVPAIHIISVIVSFIIVYFVARFLLWLIILLINAMFNSGAFGVLNKILGSVFGLAFAVIIAWAATAAFDYIICLPAFAEVEWMVGFEGGYIYQFFKTFSPVDLLLSF